MADNSTSSDGDATLMHCWKVQATAGGEQVLATTSGAACAVSVDFPLVTLRFAPNETIPVFWTARLLSSTQTTNDLKMKNPPVATLTSTPDNSGQLMQISATQVRVCTSRTACDPTTATSVATSALQSGNFPVSGGSMFFQALKEISVAKTGSYVVAAQVRIIDDVDPTISYYYSAFSDIFVMSDTKRTAVYDRKTTYCRRRAQSTAATTLLKSDVIAESSSCELQVVVTSADVTQPNTTLTVNWEATLTRNASKDIRFPTPLTTVDVNADKNYYEIVGSTIKVCKKGVQCDEYSSSDELEPVTGSTIHFGNFTNGVAKFNVDLKLPSTGMYGAFAQMVLAAPNDRRFDVTTYFQIVVTDENVGKQVSDEQYVMGNGAFYCWQEVGLANSTSTVATTSVMAMAKNDDCPYEVDMAISSSAITTTEAMTVDWTVKQRSSYSKTKFSNGVNITTVYDAATNAYVNLPQSALYLCNTTACTPFSAQKQLVVAAPATNFDDGVARFTSQNISFPTAGNYTIFVHAVMANGDSIRFDSAAFASLAVAAPAIASKKGSSIGTIIGVVAAVIGAVLLVLLLVISTRRYLARRRKEPTSKATVFGFRSHALESPQRGDLPTASRESNMSDTSFMYVKAAPSPLEDIRANSLSYDPYSRTSFNELAVDDANYTFALPVSPEKYAHPVAEPLTYRV